MSDRPFALICSACLFVRPRPGLDDDSLAETEILTVIHGQMVCVRHAQCAAPTHHDTLRNAVGLESRGEMDSLSQYQDWRRQQEQR